MQYDGPTEFTYGARTTISRQSFGLIMTIRCMNEVLDESAFDMLNTYCALMNSNEDIVIKENGADSPVELLGTIGKIHHCWHDL